MKPPVLHSGIASAGLVGRLLAHGLSWAAHRVSVFARSSDPEPTASARGAASFTAPGIVGRQGRTGSPRACSQVLIDWRRLDGELQGAPCLRAHGTLALGEKPPVESRGGPIDEAVPLSPAQLAWLEPRVGRREDAWLVTDEAVVDAPATLRALHRHGTGVQWRWGCEALAVQPGALALSGSRRGGRHFDAVFDSRGVGACEELEPRLVRHDMETLDLPSHGLRRPVRWCAAEMDPRVPRGPSPSAAAAGPGPARPRLQPRNPEGGRRAAAPPCPASSPRRRLRADAQP